MIYIDRSKLPEPTVIKTKRFRELITKLLEEKSNHDFEKHKTILSALSKDLKKLYKNKCGYCEPRVNSASHIHIDHFRPKKKLKKIVGIPVIIGSVTSGPTCFPRVPGATVQNPINFRLPLPGQGLSSRQ